MRGPAAEARTGPWTGSAALGSSGRRSFQGLHDPCPERGQPRRRVLPPGFWELREALVAVRLGHRGKARPAFALVEDVNLEPTGERFLGEPHTPVGAKRGHALAVRRPPRQRVRVLRLHVRKPRDAGPPPLPFAHVGRDGIRRELVPGGSKASVRPAAGGRQFVGAEFVDCYSTPPATGPSALAIS